jgi:hypothetical protein
MNHVLVHTNGSASSSSWMQQSVRQFFSAFNWEDHSPEVQELKLNAFRGSDQPLSLLLTVSQFFSAINWDGDPIASTVSSTEDHPELDTRTDALTLDDFSNLF